MLLNVNKLNTLLLLLFMFVYLFKLTIKKYLFNIYLIK